MRRQAETEVDEQGTEMAEYEETEEDEIGGEGGYR